MGDPLERLELEDVVASVDLDSSIEGDWCMEIDPSFQENIATAEDWRKSLNEVVPTVVVPQTTACHAFDAKSLGARYATILNLLFLNHEEIPPVLEVACVGLKKGCGKATIEVSIFDWASFEKLFNWITSEIILVALCLSRKIIPLGLIAPQTGQPY
ncbi:hypothetical protein VNO77_19210 [Canavalia gladiata]|uniref:Uncharacterized protein n=1 Tax=Canavalia gladiata TaxID=3824 RepID=A0AAN9LMY1_CANGL